MSVLDTIKHIYDTYGTRFVEKVFPDILVPEEDKIFAQIANQSYLSPDVREKILWNYLLDEVHSTVTTCVYINQTAKICILWYRWTVVKDIHDIMSDAQMVLDIQGIDPRVSEALAIYDVLRREYQGYALQVCGHSLWGTISYIVSKHRLADRCVVFNPGVSLNTFFVQMLEDTLKHVAWTKRTYTYKIFGDVISTLAFVGHTKTFALKAKDPLALHAMKNFL